MGSRDPLSPMENFPYLLEHVSTWIDTRMYTSLCKERGAKPWPNSRVNAKLKHRLFVEAGIHSVLSVTFHSPMELSMEWKRPNSSAFVDNYHYLSFVIQWKIPILVGETQNGKDGKIMSGYFPMELFPNLDNILHKMRIFSEFFVYTEYE